jgi:hypothetical protein
MKLYAIDVAEYLVFAIQKIISSHSASVNFHFLIIIAELSAEFAQN